MFFLSPSNLVRAQSFFMKKILSETSIAICRAGNQYIVQCSVYGQMVRVLLVLVYTSTITSTDTLHYVPVLVVVPVQIHCAVHNVFVQCALCTSTCSSTSTSTQCTLYQYQNQQQYKYIVHKCSVSVSIKCWLVRPSIVLVHTSTISTIIYQSQYKYILVLVQCLSINKRLVGETITSTGTSTDTSTTSTIIKQQYSYIVYTSTSTSAVSQYQ